MFRILRFCRQRIGPGPFSVIVSGSRASEDAGFHRFYGVFPAEEVRFYPVFFFRKVQEGYGRWMETGDLFRVLRTGDSRGSWIFQGVSVRRFYGRATAMITCTARMLVYEKDAPDAGCILREKTRVQGFRGRCLQAALSVKRNEIRTYTGRGTVRRGNASGDNR